MKQAYLSIALVWLAGCGRQTIVDPLPAGAEIESMKLEIPCFTTRKVDAFSVPESRWEQIFSALRPAYRDAHPAKWQVLGTIQLACKGNKQFVIELFDTGGGPGAFAAGETFETRSYYRGGDSDKLKAALLEAQLGAVPN